LTRDRQLLKRRQVTHGLCLHSQVPREQALEVLRRFDLAGQLAPLTRCLRCNGLLQAVGLELASGRLPAGARAGVTRLAECTDCHRLYWDGSHYPRLLAVAENLRTQAEANSS
jgi:hypothetical protein